MSYNISVKASQLHWYSAKANTSNTSVNKLGCVPPYINRLTPSPCWTQLVTELHSSKWPTSSSPQFDTKWFSYTNEGSACITRLVKLLLWPQAMVGALKEEAVKCTLAPNGASRIITHDQQPFCLDKAESGWTYLLHCLSVHSFIFATNKRRESKWINLLSHWNPYMTIPTGEQKQFWQTLSPQLVTAPELPNNYLITIYYSVPLPY